MIERKEVKHDKFYTTVTYEVSHSTQGMEGTTLSQDAVFKINNHTGSVEVTMNITDLKASNTEEAKKKLIDWLIRLAAGLNDDQLIKVTI